MSKADKIKNTLQETKERRKTQRPVVFQLKLQNLSKQRIEKLKRAFLEAKWFYNWLVSDLDRLNRPANKVGMVEVKVGNVFEERELIILGSQIKQ
ncbi:MAG: transposase, partial [Pseudothermotoga sp.]|nr:transposase [Pseudothermotoga sp.]